MSKPAASVIDVDPATATRWLARNEKNRHVRKPMVSAYARDMAAGDWQFTGEAIKFDRDGNLIDGQHRLNAVVRSGATVRMLVVRDLAPEAQSVLDTGAKRSASDALSLTGHAHSHGLAAVTRMCILLDRGAEHGVVTHSEIASYIDAHPDLPAAVSKQSKYAAHLDLTPRVISYLCLTFARVDQDACEQFFDSLANNQTNGPGDPRNTMIRKLSEARRRGERVTPVEQIHIVTRAWNAWREGRQLRLIKFVTRPDVASIPEAV